jgi:hypothetical protein
VLVKSEFTALPYHAKLIEVDRKCHEEMRVLALEGPESRATTMTVIKEYCHRGL